MKTLVCLLLLGATLGATTTLRDYHTGIATSMSACKGALGSVHFEHGQAMVFASPGVNEALNTGSESGAQGVTFTNQKTHARASFDIYPKSRTISAKHVKVKIPTRFACILPD